MALFRDLNTIASDSGFQGRCRYALMVAAVNVLAEVNTTTNHNKRANYGLAVLAGSANMLLVAILVLTNATIAAEANAATAPDFAIPDADIQFAVNSLFNDLAGVTT